MTTSSLAAVTVGQSVSTSLASSGGTAPLTWSISAGTLPAGITLNPSTGAIDRYADHRRDGQLHRHRHRREYPHDGQALTWTVNAAPSISTSSLAATTVGAAYSQTCECTGGTGALTWSIASGALPAGLSLNPSTGAITGTSTAAGTASFTARVTDTNSVTADQALAIVVNPAPSVTTASLALGVTTVAYSQTLASTGGTGAHAWSIPAGALPAGLTLNPSTGAITGTPTATGQTANFTVRVADSLGISASKALSIEVVDRPEHHHHVARRGHSGAERFDRRSPPRRARRRYIWSVSTGALPAGLTLNPSTGAIDRHADRRRDSQLHPQGHRCAHSLEDDADTERGP